LKARPEEEGGPRTPYLPLVLLKGPLKARPEEEGSPGKALQRPRKGPGKALKKALQRLWKKPLKGPAKALQRPN